MIIKCENCDFIKEIQSVTLEDEQCPKCKKWLSLTAYDKIQ